MNDPRKNSAYSKSGGFSLIEVLVTVALLSIMSGIGISLYAIINNSYNRAKSISDIQSQGSSIMEQIERSVRSGVSISSDTADCTGSPKACIAITLPPDSLDYKVNGGCDIVEYSYVMATAQDNGTLTRYLKRKDGSNCGGTVQMFDTDNRKGISVEEVAGLPVFNLVQESTGQPHVTVALRLVQGVALKGSPDKRSQVPFITTISLRDYSK
jgi:prepilin-type N-terminal cleavage/methylation domain-containing protein